MNFTNTKELLTFLQNPALTAEQINEYMKQVPNGVKYDHTSRNWGHDFDRSSMSSFNSFVHKASLIQYHTPRVGDLLLGKMYMHKIVHIERFDNVEDAYWVWTVMYKRK